MRNITQNFIINKKLYFKGFPILDINGQELSKAAKKKLEKLYETQVKNYQEYLESQKKGATENNVEK